MSALCWASSAADANEAQAMWGRLIWVSNRTAAHRAASLQRRRISRVIDLSGGPEYPLPPGCERLVVKLGDTQDADVLAVLDLCHAFVDSALAQPSQRVLVHCAMGASRSATIVISWLMTRQGMSLRRALNHCKRRRHAVRPNNGFFQKLRKMDLRLHGTDSMPFGQLEYTRWCLEHPGGEQAGPLCCAVC